MDEEGAILKKEDSFHLSNWKKLIYIMGEIEKNVDVDEEEFEPPRGPNINHEGLSNSPRWSWPWKIQKGKILSSKNDTKHLVVSDVDTNNEFNNRQNKTSLPKTKFSFNEELENREKNTECNVSSIKYQRQILIDKGTTLEDKHDKIRTEYDLRSALGFMSTTNVLAMGIAVPNSLVYTSFDNSYKISCLPFPAAVEATDTDHPILPLFHIDNNNKQKVEKHNTNKEHNANNLTTASSSSYCLQCEAIGSVSINERDEENVIWPERNSFCSNENLHHDVGTKAYESKFMVDANLMPFKEYDNVSLQTLNKLQQRGTESQGCKHHDSNGVRLVGNKDMKGTEEGISSICSNSVVTEKRQVEECRHCSSARTEEKHLLLKVQETSTKTTTNDEIQGCDISPKLLYTHYENVASGNSLLGLRKASFENLEKNCVMSDCDSLKCECDGSFKKLSNLVKRATLKKNTSIYNYEGYRGIESLNCTYEIFYYL